MSLIERAFSLSASGSCPDRKALERALQAEGFANTEIWSQLSSPLLSRQLAAARPPKPTVR